MSAGEISRRTFLGQSAALAAAGASPALNHNPDMEYRRLGKTGLMVSAVCLGGHWKRLDGLVRNVFTGKGLTVDLNNPEFARNRREVVSRAIELGINYVDACTGIEILAYSEALRGRRDRMYLGYSWAQKEARFPEWRTARSLLQSLDEGLREARLDYVDLWRITCFESGGHHTFDESSEIALALDKAKQQGKARFTGISSHDRPWLKMMIEQFPGQVEAVLFPYTAGSKSLPKDSLFDSVKRHDVGVFGIKPFSSNALFQGDGSPGSPAREEDDRRARLAIRHILANPAITAPIPGVVSVAQVDNLAKAVAERRELDAPETAALRHAADTAWSRLPAGYGWLRDWEYV